MLLRLREASELSHVPPAEVDEDFEIPIVNSSLTPREMTPTGRPPRRWLPLLGVVAIAIVMVVLWRARGESNGSTQPPDRAPDETAPALPPPPGPTRIEPAPAASIVGEVESDGVSRRLDIAAQDTLVEEPRVEEPRVEPDPDLYMSNARRHLASTYGGHVQECFEAGDTRRPGLSGRIGMAFLLFPDGRVESARITNNTMGDALVGTCLVDAARSWQLPPPPRGTLELSMSFSR